MDEAGLRSLDADFRRLADGDRSVFRSVFDALWPVLRSYCAKALGEGPDAEDAAQSALVKLFGQVEGYDPCRPAVAWALALAAWECRTVRRQRTRSRLVPEEAGAEAPSGDASPEDVSTDRELVRLAREVLAASSPADRQALALAFGEAFEPGPQSPAIRKRKERALTRLREAFRRFYGSF